MSNLKLFLKENKAVKNNVFYQATKSLKDENGEPLKWEIKPITTNMNDKLREECTSEVQVSGKMGVYRQRFNAREYIRKLVVNSIVFPDLKNAELQNSYGVMTAEDLIVEMIDDSGEFDDLVMFIQDLNNFPTLEDKVEEAKN